METIPVEEEQAVEEEKKALNNGEVLGSSTDTVHSLTKIKLESARTLEDAEEWEELVMTVDSGAGATVINPNMVKAVEAKNPRPEIKYEAADGGHIPNMGETVSRLSPTVVFYGA